jgi:hypothetical protein
MEQERIEIEGQLVRSYQLPQGSGGGQLRHKKAPDDAGAFALLI